MNRKYFCESIAGGVVIFIPSVFNIIMLEVTEKYVILYITNGDTLEIICEYICEYKCKRMVRFCYANVER